MGDKNRVGTITNSDLQLKVGHTILKSMYVSDPSGTNVYCVYDATTTPELDCMCCPVLDMCGNPVLVFCGTVIATIDGTSAKNNISYINRPINNGLAVENAGACPGTGSVLTVVFE